MSQESTTSALDTRFELEIVPIWTTSHFPTELRACTFHTNTKTGERELVGIREMSTAFSSAKIARHFTADDIIHVLINPKGFDLGKASTLRGMVKRQVTYFKRLAQEKSNVA